MLAFIEFDDVCCQYLILTMSLFSEKRNADYVCQKIEAKRCNAAHLSLTAHSLIDFTGEKRH